jgi:hypothetical protein
VRSTRRAGGATRAAGPLRLAALVVLVARAALAHSESPEAIVADLGRPVQRTRLGIERVVRDERNPRVLVVRVGAAWYELPAEVRRKRAGQWLARWRHAVPQGVVAVLDAASDRPVVQFNRGVVGAVSGPPG